MKKFIDYANFKEDYSLKRYAIKLAVNTRIYSKLTKNGASISFQYLMLKYFNPLYIEKAYEYYSKRNFVLDEVADGKRYKYHTVSGHFTKIEFESFEQFVHSYKFIGQADKVNFAAKLVLYYLFEKGIIGTGFEPKDDDEKYKLPMDKKKSSSKTKKKSNKIVANISIEIINKTEVNVK